MLAAFEQHLEEFREKQDVVVGAPGVVFLAGEHGVLDGALAICQQMEQRVWVGLRYAEELKDHGKTSIRIPDRGENHRVWLPGFDKPLPIGRFRPPVGGTEWPERTRALELLLDEREGAWYEGPGT